jgi:hypothetical protein
MAKQPGGSSVQGSSSDRSYEPGVPVPSPEPESARECLKQDATSYLGSGAGPEGFRVRLLLVPGQQDVVDERVLVALEPRDLQGQRVKILHPSAFTHGPIVRRVCHKVKRREVRCLRCCRYGLLQRMGGWDSSKLAADRTLIDIGTAPPGRSRRAPTPAVRTTT